MCKKWDVVPISQIARKVSRPESVDSSKVYRLLGAHWYAKGLYVKDEKPGMEIRAGKLFAVKPGDFVYNRLFAWKGSFAVAGKEHEGCFVSNEFPCFELDRERIVARFLWLYFSRESAWLEALGLSSGSTPTSRNRLKEEQFLQMQIPLPPLDEQRRIVARIEELAAPVEEAQGLRVKAREETGLLVNHALEQILGRSAHRSGWQSGPISEFAEVNPSRKEQIKLKPSDLVSFVPMRAVDDMTGIIAWPETRAYGEVSKGYKWFANGDVIFARITPCMENGKAAVARDLENGVGFGSTEFIVIRPSPQVSSEWIHALVRLRSFRRDAADHFKGTAGQQRVPPSFIRNKIISVPPVSEQRRIVAYLDGLRAQVDELATLQDATQAELDALLPSVLDQAFRGEL